MGIPRFNPPHNAARNDDLYGVELALECNADVNGQDWLGNTPLHIACAGRKIEIVSALLKFKADVNIENRDGDTPLCIAASFGNPEVLRLLLDAGANPNHKNGQPYFRACSGGGAAARELLGPLTKLNK